MQSGDDWLTLYTCPLEFAGMGAVGPVGIRMRHAGDYLNPTAFLRKLAVPSGRHSYADERSAAD